MRRGALISIIAAWQCSALAPANSIIKTAPRWKTEGKLCEEYCDGWNQELSFWGRRLGHNYQTTDAALKYYLTNMKEHCDPDSDKC